MSSLFAAAAMFATILNAFGQRLCALGFVTRKRRESKMQIEAGERVVRVFCDSLVLCVYQFCVRFTHASQQLIWTVH